MALTSDPCMLPLLHDSDASSRLSLWKWDDADPTAEPVEISIVIVTWNSAGWIERCLASIPTGADGPSYEILVHDNASSDGTADLIERSRANNLHLTRETRNAGFAGGVNAAAAKARGRFIFLLNPDCELQPGALKLLADLLKSDESAAGVAPLLLGDDGISQREFQLRRLPTFGTFVSEILFAGKLWPSNRISARYRYRESQLEEIRTVEQPAGAALLLRREVFERLGGFDERFSPAWFEDVDFCRRAAAAELPILLSTSALVTHHGGASLPRLGLGPFLRIWYRNLYRYGEKWFSPEEVAVLRWVIIGGMLLRCAATLIGFGEGSEQISQTCRAYWDVAKDAFQRWPPPYRSS